MDELDISEQIAALRATFADIRAVVGVEALQAEIAELSEQAGTPNLWDDPEQAQKDRGFHEEAKLATAEKGQAMIDIAARWVADKMRGMIG